MNRSNDESDIRTTTGAKGPGRARRAIAAVAKTMGLAVVFALAAAGGVLLHIGAPAPRRFAVARLNGALEGMFKGRIVVHRVGVLKLTRVEGVDAEVFDPEGTRVLDVHGVRARFGTIALLRSLIGGDELVLHIPELSIDAAEAVLEEDAEGKLGLVRAFDTSTPKSDRPSRGTDISIPDIRLGHAWVHGHMAAVPVLDADLKGFLGAFGSTPKNTAIDVEHLFVVGRGLPGKNPEGTIVASASLSSDPKGDTHASARYEGRVGEIPINANGSMDGKEVVAIIDVPETAPTAFAALAPGQIHLGAPVSAHAEVHGTRSVLRPELHAKIGEGYITASGTVTLPEQPNTDLMASAKVDAKDIDLSVLQEGAPASRLTTSVEASVISRPRGKLSGTFKIENQTGEVSGQVVPRASVQGEFTERSARGTAQIAERGAPTTVRFSLEPRPGSESPNDLAFDVETKVADLRAIERVGPIGRGSVDLHVDGHMDLEAKRLEAKARGEASRLDMSGVRLERGFVTGTVDGGLDSLRFAARVNGVGMRALGYTFTSVSASASGSPRAIDVTAKLVGSERAPNVAARAHVTNRDGLVVRGARVEIEREDMKGTATIATVRVAGGAVDIRGMTVEGLGDPVDATATIASSGMTVKAKGTGVDLARVAKLLGREEDARGHLAFDVNLSTNRGRVKGRVDARVGDLSVRRVQGANIHVAATIDGTHLRGEVVAALGDVGGFNVSATDLVLGGSATTADAWKTATGAVSASGTIDLHRLLEQLPRASWPVDSASGKVAIRGNASRAHAGASPVVELDVSTEGLALVGKQAKQKNADGSIMLGPAPWRTEGLDGTITTKVDGLTGHTELSGKLHDERGPLMTLDAKATLPLAGIVKEPGRLVVLAGDVPIEAKLAIPKRPLEAMPPLFGKIPMKGEVFVAMDLQGTARAPRLALKVNGTNLLPKDAAKCVLPVDVAAKLAYDGEEGDIEVEAMRNGSVVMNADATVKVNLARAMAGALAWEASSNIELSALPLDVVGALVSQPIAGDVSGRVAIADLHRGASLEANLDLHGLTLDRAAFPNGKVRVTMKDGSVTASVRLDQVDGYAETTATGAMAWGTALAPQIDLAKPVDVEVRAKNFRANAAMPFLQGILTELDGRIDTDAKLRVESGGKDGHMNGAIVIRDGSFEVPQIGERFQALQGRVIMKPWGTLRFEGFSAEASTGKILAAAQIVLKGLALDSAVANIRIPKGQSIPIPVEDVPLGRAFGDITARAKASADGKRLDVNIGVPLLQVDLPRSTGHAVQTLEQDKTVRVGAHTGGEFIAIPLARPEKPRAPSDRMIRAAIDLGSNTLQVKRDTTVDVVLQGKTVIEVTDKTHVTGQIRLLRGKLELQGKQFVIDRGEVTFVGNDPSDPMVIATAYWDAPGGTRVYADFSGHVNSGKLTLRSEPELSQDEILALILFGSADGSFGAQAPPGREESNTVKAAGMVGGVVAQGINKAISGITTADITTRVDTSESDNPRPELAVQISKDVSARVGYKLGVPAPGENPDRTELTLDWRFIRNWSLTTTVGDQGSTSLDMVWRMRY